MNEEFTRADAHLIKEYKYVHDVLLDQGGKKALDVPFPFVAHPCWADIRKSCAKLDIKEI